MSIAYRASLVLSIVLFLAYGIHILFLGGMAADFERFGLSRIRRLTGALEVLGALGLIVGVLVPMPLLVVPTASALAALMLFGIAARIRARDACSKSLPALALLVINVFVVAYALGVVDAV